MADAAAGSGSATAPSAVQVGVYGDHDSVGAGGGVPGRAEVVHGEHGVRPPAAVEQSGAFLKDKMFLALFAGQILVVSMMAVVAGAGSSRVKWLAGESAREQTTGVWLVSAAVGGVLGLAALGVAYTPALHDGLVRYSQRAAAAALSCLALLMALQARWFLFVVLLVIIGFDLVWFVQATDRLQFVNVLLGVACTALREHTRLPAVIAGAVVLHTGYSMVWALMVVNVLRTGKGRGEDAVFLGVMLFSYRWTTLVIKGVVRVTVAGAVTDSLRVPLDGASLGTDHTGLGDTMPLTSALAQLAQEEEDDAIIADSPRSHEARAAGVRAPLVPKYLRAACLTSIGSICAGALVGAVTPVLWACLRALRRLEATRCRGCFAPLAAATETMLVMSHKYAYPDVAVHGKPWFQAARESWKAFNDRGLEAVVSNDASDRVLLFLCYAVGGLLAFCGYFALSQSVHAWTFVLFISFWFGVAATSLSLTAVETVVTSLFVSFAYFPESLSQRHPIIYHRLCRISEVRHFQRHNQEGGL